MTRQFLSLIGFGFLIQPFGACATERAPLPEVVAKSDSPGRPPTLPPLDSISELRQGIPSEAAHPCRSAAGGSITVRDTTEYRNDNGGGWVGLFYLGNTFVDSVDIEFGVHRVGRDSLVFLPVIVDDIGDHLLYNGSTCVPLATRLPYLDSYFSSPSVEQNSFLYWGMKKLSERAYAIYAMRYDLARAKLDSLLLDTLAIATDYRFYFAAPKVVGDSIEYKGQSIRYMIDRDHKRVLQRSVRPPT